MKPTSTIGAAAVLLVILGTVISCHTGDKSVKAPVPQETPTATQAIERSLSLTATGDCTLATDEFFDRSTGFVTYAENYGYEYFFENVRSIFEEDDLTIVNFEGTLSNRGTRENKQFAFRGEPAYVNILTSSSVEAANLANNHSSDYGPESLSDTKDYLEAAGIFTCRGRDNVTVKDINGIKVGLVGINYLNDQMRLELEDSIAEAKNRGAELIILSMHWGIEKATAPNADQIEAAHRAVDCGANLVIGHHPHVLQGIEKYNGAYICYSLGNFCFGGNSSPSDKNTVIFRQKFTFNGDTLLDDDNIEVIPCRISGADGYNDYQPKPAEGEQKQYIINRMTEYTNALGSLSIRFR